MICCPECERLTNLYADLVQENAELLKEYHAALYARDIKKVNRIGEALPAMEEFRREAKEIMVAHRATHDTPQEVDSAVSGK